MLKKKTRLAAVAELPADAPVIHLENAPFLKGNESENLLCGHCTLVLCKGVSVESCVQQFSAPVDFFVRCPKCGAHNRVEAKPGD